MSLRYNVAIVDSW